MNTLVCHLNSLTRDATVIFSCGQCGLMTQSWVPLWEFPSFGGSYRSVVRGYTPSLGVILIQGLVNGVKDLDPLLHLQQLWRAIPGPGVSVRHLVQLPLSLIPASVLSPAPSPPVGVLFPQKPPQNLFHTIPLKGNPT